MAEIALIMNINDKIDDEIDKCIDDIGFQNHTKSTTTEFCGYF